ncbi:hemerythrin domain-containing protein, partial [Tsukamurella spumae]
MTTTENRPQTEEMVIVHTVFRTHLAALPGLVSAVPDGDRSRAADLVDWLTELLTGLHHHHVGEDELMWPLLASRAPQDRSLVLRMEEQHSRIADLVTGCHREGAAFRESGGRTEGRTLAATLRDLNESLAEHLSDEERYVLPIVREVMSADEWRALADRGNASIPKERRLVFLGFMLQSATREQRDLLMAQLPLPARVLWRLVGRRDFARAYRQIYGAG